MILTVILDNVFADPIVIIHDFTTVSPQFTIE